MAGKPIRKEYLKLRMDQSPVLSASRPFYERDERELPLPFAVKLARFYETSVDYLLNLTDMKEPYPRKK